MQHAKITWLLDICLLTPPPCMFMPCHDYQTYWHFCWQHAVLQCMGCCLSLIGILRVWSIDSWTKWMTFWQTMFLNALSLLKMTCVVFQISLKFVPMGPIESNSVLFEVMAWHQNRWQAIMLNQWCYNLLIHMYIIRLNMLTHCGLVMPFGIKHLTQHWFIDLLSFRTPGTNFDEIWIIIQDLSIKNAHKNVVCKMVAS